MLIKSVINEIIIQQCLKNHIFLSAWKPALKHPYFFLKRFKVRSEKLVKLRFSLGSIYSPFLLEASLEDEERRYSSSQKYSKLAVVCIIIDL